MEDQKTVHRIQVILACFAFLLFTLPGDASARYRVRGQRRTDDGHVPFGLQVAQAERDGGTCGYCCREWRIFQIENCCRKICSGSLWETRFDASLLRNNLSQDYQVIARCASNLRECITR